jgi:hypothetical protein
LACVNRKVCDDYVRQRGANAAARRELEDLRAAIVTTIGRRDYVKPLTPVVPTARPSA